MSKLARRYRRNNSSSSSSSGTKTKKMKKKTWRGPPGRPPGVPWTKNPPVFQDITDFILPGFGGYGATRLLGRITHVQVAKRWPRFGKHASALSALVSFGAAWLAAHRVKALAKYHTPIVVGSGIAALQTLVQTYLPWLGWMTSDVQDSEVNKQLPATTAEAPMAVGHSVFDDLDEAGEEWATYNDAFDQGSYKSSVPGPASVAEAAAARSDPMDVLSDLDEDLGAGIFAN